MNKKIQIAILALSCLALPLVPAGCTATQQRKTVNTISTIETTATAAVDGYFDLVIQGKVSTNGIPEVTRAYNAFQQAVKAATDASQADTNALAPGSLILLSRDLVNIITQAKGQ